MGSLGRKSRARCWSRSYPRPPPARPRRFCNELAELKRAQEELKEAQTKREVQAANERNRQAIDAYLNQAYQFVKADPDTYELTNTFENYNLIADTIDAYAQNTYKETGKAELLPIEKAAKLVEKYLEEEYFDRGYSKLAQTKKFKAKFTKEVEAPQQEQMLVETVQAPRTLSNSMTSTSLTGIGRTKTRQTQEEKIAAIAEKYNRSR